MTPLESWLLLISIGICVWLTVWIVGELRRRGAEQRRQRFIDDALERRYGGN